MNAVDTNVLLYSLDVDEPVKQAKAKALLLGLMGTTSDDNLDLAGRWRTLALAA